MTRTVLNHIHPHTLTEPLKTRHATLVRSIMKTLLFPLEIQDAKARTSRFALARLSMACRRTRGLDRASQPAAPPMLAMVEGVPMYRLIEIVNATVLSSFLFFFHLPWRSG